MLLATLFTRQTRQDTPAPEIPIDTAAEKPEVNVLMRFLTQGGATVEVHPKEFTARFDYRGAPYAVETPYKVDGFNWRCAGCAGFGRENETYYELGFRRIGEARDEANQHAKDCQSMPKPTA